MYRYPQNQRKREEMNFETRFGIYCFPITAGFLGWMYGSVAGVVAEHWSSNPNGDKLLECMLYGACIGAGIGLIASATLLTYDKLRECRNRK